MENSNKLSAHLLVQHLYVALLSVLTTCKEITNFNFEMLTFYYKFHWNVSWNVQLSVFHIHNTTLRLSNGLLIQSIACAFEHYIFHGSPHNVAIV